MTRPTPSGANRGVIPGVQPPMPGYGSSWPAAESIPGVEARLRVRTIAAARVTGFVQMHPAVVHDATIAGPKLDAVDRHVVVERKRHGKRPVDIRPIGRDDERLGHGENQVGLPEPPAIGELRWLGRSAGLPGSQPVSAHRPRISFSMTESRAASRNTPAPG